MKKIYIISFLSFLFLQQITAQQINNLVPNGDFSEIDSCFGWGYSIWKAPYWGAALPNQYCSSDYFNECQFNESFTPLPPINEYLIKESHGCAGILAITENSFYREYLQVTLESVLVKDTFYIFKISIIPYYDFAQMGLFVNRLEFLLENNKISAPLVQGYIPGRIDTTPSLVYLGAFLNDTANWTTLTFTYKAKGGEQWLTIGNFSPDNLIGTQRANDGYQGPYKNAYYLIDNVKLYKASDTLVRKLPEPIMPNVFSPNQDGVNEYYKIENLPENSSLEVFNRWGSVVFKQQPYQNNWPGNAPNGQPLAAGVYFAILTYQDKNGQLQQKKQTVHLAR